MPIVVLKLIAGQGTGRTVNSGDYMLPSLGSIKIHPQIKVQYNLYRENIEP